MEEKEAKVVLIGGPGSKGGFSDRLLGEENIDEDGKIIGAEFGAKQLQVGQTQVRLQIWDTAEQERYEALVPMYLRLAHAVLYFANLCGNDGLGDCRHKLERCPAPEGAACALVGNRPHDMPRVVSREEAEALANEFHMPYLEVCVATGEGLGEVRDLVARCAIDKGLVRNPRLEAVGAELQQLRQRRAQLERRLRARVRGEERTRRHGALEHRSEVYADMAARMLALQGTLRPALAAHGLATLQERAYQ